MTKDELHSIAQEQNNQAPAVKKDTAGTAPVPARPSQPAVLGPSLVPKPPFGMPGMLVAKNIKVIAPRPVKETEKDRP